MWGSRCSSSEGDLLFSRAGFLVDQVAGCQAVAGTNRIRVPRGLMCANADFQSPRTDCESPRRAAPGLQCDNSTGCSQLQLRWGRKNASVTHALSSVPGTWYGLMDIRGLNEDKLLILCFDLAITKTGLRQEEEGSIYVFPLLRLLQDQGLTSAS